MKTKLLFTLLLLPLLSFAQAPTDTVDIPDSHFRYALLHAQEFNFNNPIVDTNNDGEIEYGEAEAVTYLNFLDATLGSYKPEKKPSTSQNNSEPEPGIIHDLTGIEAFINLTYLNVGSADTGGANQLDSLDLSQNTELDTIYAYGNNMFYIKIGNNPNLLYLDCSVNSLTNIKLNQSSALKWLNVSENQIDSLNLSNIQNLDYVSCQKNQLVYLDLRNNNTIEAVRSYDNPDLICIFVNNKVYSENATYWIKDSTAHYVETEAECETFGAEEYAFQDISIYPNPVKDHLYIDNLQNKSKLSLYNLQGKKILSWKENEYPVTLDVSDLTSGIYFLKIKVLNTSKDFKIIKL